ncbi:MAG TPA: hypothetical protein VI111_05810 [Thermoleophilaceae bacterium]
MPRIRTRTLVALTLAVTAWACASTSTASAQTTVSASCPDSFDVLHDDSIGALSLPAGPYAITVLDASTLSCADAAELLREFLEDFDGRLAGGWRVDPSTATFTHGDRGFRVAAVINPPTPPTPPSSRVCPSYFSVLHNDHVGSFRIPKGRYRVTLLSVGRISCDQASKYFAQFLDDFDGILPRPWFVDPSTGSFMRGSRYIGFRIKSWSGPFPPNSGGGGTHPSKGGKCPSTFRVVHDDRIGTLRLPGGPYVVTAFGSVSCTQAAKQFASFLNNDYIGALPRPWRLQATSGTFLKGGGTRNGFRVKPAR